jgi:hypothetical protein
MTAAEPTMACIRKRRGKWVADYRDPSGQRRWITRDTRKEAEVALASVSVAIAKDESLRPIARQHDPFDDSEGVACAGDDLGAAAVAHVILAFAGARRAELAAKSAAT